MADPRIVHGLPLTLNLSVFFRSLPVLERPRAAARAGFRHVEMWWPFDEPEPAAADVDRLLRTLDDEGLELTGLNFFAGDLAGSDRGVLSLPDRVGEFKANVPVTTEIAERTGCRILNALLGNGSRELSIEAQREQALTSLHEAAESAARSGARVVVEPLNPIDFPRYLATTTGAAVNLVREASDAGADIGVLYDVFHMQRSEGRLIETVREHVEWLGHVQIADVPTRNEPGTGEIAFERFLPALRASGYEGWIGLEYQPSEDPASSLRWIEEMGP